MGISWDLYNHIQTFPVKGKMHIKNELVRKQMGKQWVNYVYAEYGRCDMSPIATGVNITLLNKPKQAAVDIEEELRFTRGHVFLIGYCAEKSYSREVIRFPGQFVQNFHSPLYISTLLYFHCRIPGYEFDE